MADILKQFVVVRRRSDQSIQEFLDYHYQQHGKLSASSSNPEEAPLKYYQTHFFDAIYSNIGPGQPSWTGHNDSTELFFSGIEHMKRVFSSEHVRQRIGPDGRNFNDFSAAIPILTYEKVLFDNLKDDESVTETPRITATYWVQSKTANGTSLAEALDPLITKAFADVAVKIIANVAVPDELGILKYFKGEHAPEYSAAYQIFLKDRTFINLFNLEKRKLERETAMEQLINVDSTFVVFGVRSVVYNRIAGIEFDASRQPKIF